MRVVLMPGVAALAAREADDGEGQQDALDGATSVSPTSDARYPSWGATVYSARNENNRLAFPIRRVARLRLAETLRLQQYFYASAGRIGVPTDLRPVAQPVSVALVQSGKQIGSFFDARMIQVDKWTALVAHPDTVQQTCEAHEAFASVAAHAKAYSEPFDLNAAINEGDLKDRYALDRPGKPGQPWALRVKR